MKIITNNHPRPVIEAYELSASEREDFNYLNWSKVDSGEDSASFFRYSGTLYDLGEFQRYNGYHSELKGWDGYQSDSFFSGIVVRYLGENNKFDLEPYGYVIVGRYYS